MSGRQDCASERKGDRWECVDPGVVAGVDGKKGRELQVHKQKQKQKQNLVWCRRHPSRLESLKRDSRRTGTGHGLRDVLLAEHPIGFRYRELLACDYRMLPRAELLCVAICCSVSVGQ